MQLSETIIRAAAQDAGCRSMLAAGRAAWNEDDWDAACAEYGRLSGVLWASDLLRQLAVEVGACTPLNNLPVAERPPASRMGPL